MLRRLLLVSLVALAVAAPADAFSKQTGTLRMDDGVDLAYSLYEPDGTAPAGGWPGVMVLHGLAGTKESVEAISTSFVAGGYAVLAYDARGHGASGGVVTLAGPREVADLRAVRSAFAGRPEVNERIGAWGISYGGGQIWNALAAGVPLAAAEVVETWTSLYDALWPQSLARSGIVAGLAASVAARSPLIAGLRNDAVQSTNMSAIRALSQERSALPQVSTIRTPVYLFQGRTDFVFDISQATRAYARLTGPKRLYVGAFGHAPSTFPGPDIGFVLTEGLRWFDRHLKVPPVPIAADSGVLVARQGGGAPAVFSGLPATKASTFALTGSSVLRGESIVSRRTAPLKTALESWGGGTATITLSKLVRYPRLVVTVMAGTKVVAHGGLRPRAGVNHIQLANYCVYVPKATRLRVSVGPSSPAGQFAYLGFAGAGSATLGPVTLRLSSLAKPISG
ncbi:MAG: alpha/beta hydrolase [Actinobacteria bacterium]|nr:alpha/beta hydrolase [Actinomycetota bacterium]